MKNVIDYEGRLTHSEEGWVNPIGPVWRENQIKLRSNGRGHWEWQCFACNEAVNPMFLEIHIDSAGHQKSMILVRLAR